MTDLAIALALLVLSGIAALLFWRLPRLSSAIAVIGVIGAGIAGEIAAVRGLLDPRSHAFLLPWTSPYGAIHVGIDPLSSFFLVPIFGLSALAAVFGRSYLAAHPKRRHAVAWFAFNLLVASMACVVVARQAVLFLVAWEIMSLCSYLLVTLEHERADVRRAGWVYLIAAHVGTACLLAMFLLLSRHVGGFELQARGALPSALSAALFVLAILGFGVKAGVVPMHVWLPEAHAAAPSHVSALMSGVVIKMGLYGLLRALLLIGQPKAWWGPSLVLLGLIGAILGIALALYQRDLKRVLAYSSVENMGIIVIGVGTGLWGVTSNRPAVAALGITGALIHTWNHTLMKGLLFLGAGSLVHGTGSKDLEQLGGLMKRMPRTAIPMIVGAVAIAALPPMNGFVSEWLIYVGLAQATLDANGATSVAASMVIGAISFAGALTVLCFVRLIGIALLGEPRSEGAKSAHESDASMNGVLGILAVLCVAAALSPHLLARTVAPVVEQILGRHVDAVIPTATIGLLDGLLLASIVLGAIAARALVRSKTVASDATWGCGYAAPSVRMQYTGRSFAELMAERLLPESIRPRVSVDAPNDLFPGRSALASDCADPVVRAIYEPFLTRWGDRFARLRWLQQGVLHAYLFYIVFAAVALIGWISLRSWFAR